MLSSAALNRGDVRQILPQMSGMQYLGPEYDPGPQVYRLKFLDVDRVIFVDVVARTAENCFMQTVYSIASPAPPMNAWPLCRVMGMT